MRRNRTVLILSVLALVCGPVGVEAIAQPAAPASPSSQTPPKTAGQPLPSVKRGEVIVKLKQGVSKAVLETLKQQGGVASITPLFSSLNGRSTQQLVQKIKKKFPVRSRRADPTSPIPPLENYYRIQLNDPHADPKAICQQVYQPNPSIEWCGSDPVVKALSSDPAHNDYYYNSSGSWHQLPSSGDYRDQWPLFKIHAPAAWDLSTGKGIVVGVVDSGIDYNHPDLARNMWVNAKEQHGQAGVDDDENGYVDDVYGWDFATCELFNQGYCMNPKDQDHDPMDTNSHGTHVAGLIAAVADNYQNQAQNGGIVGVAYQAQVMAVKALGMDGLGYASEIVEAFVYAAANGADVINASLGCVDGSACVDDQAITDVLDLAKALGIVVVLPAGDSVIGALAATNVPQSAGPIVVGGLTQDNEPLPIGNFGVRVDVAAPAGGTYENEQGSSQDNILSLKSLQSYVDPALEVGTGQYHYLRLEGTSLAAAQVSGVAALLLARDVSLSPEKIRQILMSTAADVYTPGPDPRTGAGLIQADAALKAVNNVLDVRITSPTTGATLSQGQQSVSILGTAQGQTFQSYQLLFHRDIAPTTWETIPCPNGSASPCPTPVDNGELGRWTIGTFPDGLYILKLVAQSTGSDTPFIDLVQVEVAHSAPQQITTSPYDQVFPSVSDHAIVWEDFRDGDLTHIYTYDLTAHHEQRLESSPPSSAYERFPMTSDRWVVWQDQRSGDWHIYLKDLTKPSDPAQLISRNSGTQLHPAIYGQYVVWLDYQNGETTNRNIYLYDLVTKKTIPLSDLTVVRRRSAPAISERYVVWFEYPESSSNPQQNHPYSQLYVYDLKNLPANKTSQVTITSHALYDADHPEDQPKTLYRPSIWKNRVVWSGFNDTTHNWDTYFLAYDPTVVDDPADADEEQTIVNLTPEADPNQITYVNPVISGDRIIWQQLKDDGQVDLYLYDLTHADAGAQRLTFNGANQSNPSLVGNLLAYQDDRHGNSDIYLQTLPSTEPQTTDLTISGIITGLPEGTVADVTLVGAEVSQPVQKVTTDSTGHYAFAKLSSGAYAVQPLPTKTLKFQPPTQPVQLTDHSEVAVNFTAVTRQADDLPPVFRPMPSQTVAANELLSFLVYAQDPEGTQLTLKAYGSAPSAGAKFVDNGNGTGHFSWTPTTAQVQTEPYEVIFVANDETGQTASRRVLIFVTPPVDQPKGSYTINGRVTLKGQSDQGLAGVLMRAVSPSGKIYEGTATATDGSYTLTGLPNGTYTIVPIDLKYQFDPPSKHVTVTNANQTNVNFRALQRPTVAVQHPPQVTLPVAVVPPSQTSPHPQSSSSEKKL